MMKYVITLILFASISVHAQSTFQLGVGRSQDPSDFAQTSDHGYIIGGNMLDTVSGLSDVYSLVKIDSLGNGQWAGLYSDMGHDSYITSLFQSSDGNYVFSGYPDGLFTHDCIMAKVNSSGNLMWSTTFSLGGQYSAIPPHCLETTDGKYAIAVNLNAQFPSPSCIALIKLDPSGSIIWEYNYSDTINFLECKAIATTRDNGFIITGAAYSQYCFLLRIDSTGHPMWYKQYHDFQGFAPGSSVKQTFDNGFIVTTSQYYSGPALIIKTDSVGDTLWTRVLSGPDYHTIKSVQQETDSSFIFAGGVGDYNNNAQQFFLVKMNGSGDTTWTKSYSIPSGHNLTGIKIDTTEDGGLITLCMNFIFPLLIKTDANGNMQCNQSNSSTTIEQHTIQVLNGSLQIDSTQSQGGIGLYGVQFYPISSSISCLSLSVGDEQNIQHNISIFPNPATEKISIISDDEIESATVFNIVGAPVLSSTKKNVIDISSLDAGIYFIRVKIVSGFYSMKFVKQ